MTSTHYVLAMLLSGWLLGSVFDLYNTVTGSSKWLRWLRPILDITFWVCGGVFVYNLTLLTDNGRFRIYTFLLVGLGYLTYYWIARRYVIGSAFAVVRVIQLICLGLWRVVRVLVWNPFMAVVRLACSTLCSLYRICLRLEDAAVWLVSCLLRIGLFPISPHLRAGSQLRAKFDRRIEGIWARLSNWLKKSPNGA